MTKRRFIRWIVEQLVNIAWKLECMANTVTIAAEHVNDMWGDGRDDMYTDMGV